MVPLVPGGFDFERERTRSVSPLTGRDKSKVRRRVAYPTSPSKAGVRFALVGSISVDVFILLTNVTSQRRAVQSTRSSLKLHHHAKIH
jgi:hypothetical protein